MFSFAGQSPSGENRQEKQDQHEGNRFLLKMTFQTQTSHRTVPSPNLESMVLVHNLISIIGDKQSIGVTKSQKGGRT